MSKIDIKLPEGWKCRFGLDTLEASNPQTGASIDITVGQMPPETTAEDEAIYNYMDMVGFDEDDEAAPIVSWKFMGKRAWGFEALMEDDTPMRLMCAEPKPGKLVIVVLNAASDGEIRKLADLVSTGLSI